MRNSTMLATLSALLLIFGATAPTLAGECAGTVSAVEGNTITITCDDAATSAVGDKVTVKPTEKAVEKPEKKTTKKATEKAAPAAPAAKKKLEGC
ncbi:MAG: hypothetical protein ACOY3Z_01025 [Thermodesulfobacteriota bacterium]